MAARSSQKIMSDMDEHSKMKSEAKQWCKEALDMSEHKTEKQKAAYLKRRFDEAYGPTWHVVVGSDFKASFSHESKTYCFLSIGKTNVLIYRT